MFFEGGPDEGKHAVIDGERRRDVCALSHDVGFIQADGKAKGNACVGETIGEVLEVFTVGNNCTIVGKGHVWGELTDSAQSRAGLKCLPSGRVRSRMPSLADLIS